MNLSGGRTCGGMDYILRCIETKSNCAIIVTEYPTYTALYHHEYTNNPLFIHWIVLSCTTMLYPGVPRINFVIVAVRLIGRPTLASHHVH